MENAVAEMMTAVKDGLRQAVRDRLVNNYGRSPLDNVVNEVVQQEIAQLRTVLLDAIRGAMADNSFREQIVTALRHKLAKLLVERFGGELEKQINTLKSDPATRARIVLAIEDIVSGAKQK